jgi:NTE family protein
MRRYIISILLSVLLFSSAEAKEPVVGLVLSGGGALGYAHIGAIQALEEHGIMPTVISGSSMGAIIGSLYSAGYTPQEMLKIVQKDKLYRINKLVTLQSALTTTGMSSHEALRKILHELIPHDSFDSLEYDFTACVSNLDKGQKEYISSGNNLVDYIVASASIPGIFETKKIGGVTYVDGGVLDNMPTAAIQEKCDYLIGVDVIPFVKEIKKNNSVDVLLWSIRLIQHNNSQLGRSMCDWLIESYALIEYHELNFEHYLEIYQFGYKAAIDYIAKHPELVEKCAAK